MLEIIRQSSVSFALFKMRKNFKLVFLSFSSGLRTIPSSSSNSTADTSTSRARHSSLHLGCMIVRLSCVTICVMLLLLVCC